MIVALHLEIIVFLRFYMEEIYEKNTLSHRKIF